MNNYSISRELYTWQKKIIDFTPLYRGWIFNTHLHILWANKISIFHLCTFHTKSKGQRPSRLQILSDNLNEIYFRRFLFLRKSNAKQQSPLMRCSSIFRFSLKLFPEFHALFCATPVFHTANDDDRIIKSSFRWNFTTLLEATSNAVYGSQPNQRQ